jgi:octaprenyl-diphosphate synthase
MNSIKQRILFMVKDDIQAIEAALKENLNPHLELVSRVAGHILFSGGKRLRPLLMVLCARMCGYKGDYDKTFSTIFEFLHAATLLHDDLVDGATIRRGKPAAHTVWDNPTAILTGDFLLARSLSIAAETGNIRIIKEVAAITEKMAQGEILQLSKRGNRDITEEEYMQIIEYKTAVLFQGACRISAIIAHADAKKEIALSDYGYNLGMAFQMADDLLDYTQDSIALGKEVGADLKEGKLTLPVIRAMKTAEPNERARIISIILEKDYSETVFQELIEVLQKQDGIAYTERLAHQYALNAKNSLDCFQPSETRDILLDLADYSISREA